MCCDGKNRLRLLGDYSENSGREWGEYRRLPPITAAVKKYFLRCFVSNQIFGESLGWSRMVSDIISAARLLVWVLSWNFPWTAFYRSGSQLLRPGKYSYRRLSPILWDGLLLVWVWLRIKIASLVKAPRRCNIGISDTELLAGARKRCAGVIGICYKTVRDFPTVYCKHRSAEWKTYYIFSPLWCTRDIKMSHNMW
jgi:hypothetical protein